MYQLAILLSRMLVIVLLLIFIQDVTGVEKMSSIDDEDYSAGLSSGSGALIDYSDHSLHHELANLTSNDLINITSDVMLLSVVQLAGLENISIIGHDPTVNCDNAGGINVQFQVSHGRSAVIKMIANRQ